jgi:hypothetical protein
MRHIQRDITIKPDTVPAPKNAVSDQQTDHVSVKIASVSGWGRVKAKIVDVWSVDRSGKKDSGK